jgi:ribosomal protein S18 acetylase RimI-like enzyme
MSAAMPSFVLRDLRPDELPGAARLLGQAMRDNPVNVRAFGDDDASRERSLARFFGAVLAGARPRASVLGGFHGDGLVAVAVLAPPGKCQPTLGEKISIVPSLVRGNPLSTLGRVLRWTGAWAARDHRDPHWHLGPLAVAAHLQGQGIGKRVMADVCARMDERRGLLYLETDKPENVRFYERSGFVVRDEARVLGVPSWFMARAAR